MNETGMEDLLTMAEKRMRELTLELAELKFDREVGGGHGPTDESLEDGNRWPPEVYLLRGALGAIKADRAARQAKAAITSLSREQLKRMCQIVEEFLPTGFGFIVFAFPLGDHPDRRMKYTSNATRETAIPALKEWLIQAGHAEDWMKDV